MSFETKFAVNRSTVPLFRRSPACSEAGSTPPAPISTGGAKVPSPRPMKIDMLLESKLSTRRSDLPSPLTSATASPVGPTRRLSRPSAAARWVRPARPATADGARPAAAWRGAQTKQATRRTAVTTTRDARHPIARPRDVQFLGPPARTLLEARSILRVRYGSIGNQATALFAGVVPVNRTADRTAK